MTDLDGVEISKAISEYETMTLGYFRSQYKMDEYPHFLTSIEVRGYGRGYVDGVVFKNAKLAKVKEALEDHAKDPVSTLVAIRELLEGE